MGVIAYTCPVTRREVRTSLEAEPDTLLRLWRLKLFVCCPHCIEGHSIPVRDAVIRFVPELFPSSPPLPAPPAAAASEPAPPPTIGPARPATPLPPPPALASHRVTVVQRLDGAITSLLASAGRR